MPGVSILSIQSLVAYGYAGNSAAAEKGLRPGDVIVEVAQEEVATPQDVAAKVKAARDANRNTVLLLVDRQGDLRFVALAVNDFITKSLNVWRQARGLVAPLYLLEIDEHHARIKRQRVVQAFVFGQQLALL